MLGFMLVILIIVLLSLMVHYSYKLKRKQKLEPTNTTERLIHKRLGNLAEHLGGCELYDLMLKYKDATAQIDNVLLTQKALYVIEAKGYSGWIFGSQNNTYWTQTFTHYKAKTSGNNYTKSGVSKYKFYNPVRQNMTHINVIDKLTNVKKMLPVYNIVVFNDQATLKDINVNPDVFVVYVSDLERTIMNLERNIDQRITLVQQIRVIDALHFLDIDDAIERQNHISRIQEKYNS